MVLCISSDGSGTQNPGFRVLEVMPWRNWFFLRQVEQGISSIFFAKLLAYLIIFQSGALQNF